MTATKIAPEVVEKTTEDFKQEPKTFTAEEVESIVKERLAQQAKNRFGDYEELKTKAEGAQTLEERLGTLEGELTATKTAALRSSVAAEHGISTKKGDKGEPSDADLFLTGTDLETLASQAKRLVERVADQKKHGNVAPKEGVTTTTGDGTQDMREFAKNLFGRAD
jgi:hypothetical protein